MQSPWRRGRLHLSPKRADSTVDPPTDKTGADPKGKSRQAEPGRSGVKSIEKSKGKSVAKHKFIFSQLAMNALAKALENRWSESTRGLVHHSDQGVQYASKDYVDCLKKHSILISMSRKGNPYDNAFAESFIKTLKVEEVYLNEYGAFEDAYRNIWRFIENVYNWKRLHSSLGYKSPEQFEMEVALNTAA